MSTHSPTVINWVADRGGRVFRTTLDEDRRRIIVAPVNGLTESRALIESIGLSPADFFLADKVLWVDGPSDIPVFAAWLAKVPKAKNTNIKVLSLGGDDVASDDFDASQLAGLHPKMWAILDSERPGKDEASKKSKAKIREKLEKVGIKCHLTDRPATENYFSVRAIRQVYGTSPDALDSFGSPNLTQQGVRQFTKRRNSEVAQAMEWDEIEDTDLGKLLGEFLRC